MHDMPIFDPALPVDAAWLTLGEAGYEEPSRESPRRGVCWVLNAPCASSAELPREAAIRGLHSSSVGGDPTCKAHNVGKMRHCPIPQALLCRSLLQDMSRSSKELAAATLSVPFMLQRYLA